MAAEDRQATTAPAYAQARADYAPSRESGRGAWVTAVREGSPAWAVGIEPGMCVTTVNGQELTDMIVWLWETGEEYVDLDVFDPRDGTTTPVTLEREPSEDWGLTFCDAVFDGMRTCVNACTFCFMGMLPKHLRTTLYIRDDDYRLSFLQGNFVTLTNLSDARRAQHHREAPEPHERVATRREPGCAPPPHRQERPARYGRARSAHSR